MKKWGQITGNIKFFNKNRIIILIAFFVVLCLRLVSAWLEHNPLIGEWVVKATIEAGHLYVADPGTPLDQRLKFTASSLIIAGGSRIIEKKIIYRQDSKTNWSFSTDGGASWENLNIINSDTMEQRQFGLRIIYNRRK